MNPLILSALIAAALSAGSAYQIQEWRYGAKEKARVEQESAQALAAQRDLRALENRRYAVAASAQVAAVGRDISLRRDADGSRAALISLSNAAEQALREAGTSHDACTVRATAISELLTVCAARHRELGEKASRHVSDIQTLTDAWPRE
ncbi:MAG: hypothetical protein Q8N51_05760 [Gammaproteobacteria bacterium]|nr:hypothetical protein [Gammaproteobacteria bacterium]